VDFNGAVMTLDQLAHSRERLAFKPPRGWIGHEELT
jgi:hypothetical protein